MTIKTTLAYDFFIIFYRNITVIFTFVGYRWLCMILFTLCFLFGRTH